MFKIKLLPQDKKFFKLFNELSDSMNSIIQDFLTLCQNYDEKDALNEKIVSTEKRGNSIADELMKELLSNFVTPMDREDIHQLTKLLNSIIDHVHSAAIRLELYRISDINPELTKLAEILLVCTKELSLLVGKLDNMSELEKLSLHINTLHKLEEDGDQVYRGAIRRLFDEEKDALQVMKWKDIYDRLENAIDKCNDAGNIIMGVVLKYA